MISLSKHEAVYDRWYVEELELARNSRQVEDVKAKAFDELCDILAEGGDPESLPKEKIKMIIGLVYTVEQTIDGMTNYPGDC